MTFTLTRWLRRLLDVVGDNTPLQDAFLLADDVLRQVTQVLDMPTAVTAHCATPSSAADALREPGVLQGQKCQSRGSFLVRLHPRVPSCPQTML